METKDFPYGFRILGSPEGGERKLVDHAAAFNAYASCDSRCDLHRESYLSPFHYDASFADYLKHHGTNKGYSGPCWTPWLWFDIDREGDLPAAQRDAAKLCRRFEDCYGVQDELLAFYSGSKGYHVGLPTWLWSPEPSENFNGVCKAFALAHAAAAGVKIDPSIYTLCQPFRAPNSRHGKTGLSKRRVPVEALSELGIDGIKKLAAAPEEFEIPEPGQVHVRAVADWKAATTEATPPAPVAASDRTELNLATLQFIGQGAVTGDRHRLLYSAAANLAELGCNARLAYALLSPAALDSELKPEEVARVIKYGIARGGAQ